MRKTVIVIAVIVLATVIAVWGGTVLSGNTGQQASSVAPATTQISVMQMMKDAKNLPEQQFDAH